MSGSVVAALTAQVAPLVASAVILVALRAKPRAAAATAIAALTLSLVATAALLWRIAIPNVSWVAQAVWLPVQGSPGLTFGVMADPLATSMAFIVAFVTLAVIFVAATIAVLGVSYTETNSRTSTERTVR